MSRERRLQNPDGKPTVRQVYAIARLLLSEAGEAWPETREEASELIERFRDREDERGAGSGWGETSSRGVLLE
jgi:hypothetical protein